MSDKPTGCGTPADDNLNVCGQRNYLCESCLAAPPETTLCETCGTPTRLTGTKRCNNCWEVEKHLQHYLRSAKATAFVEQALREVRQAVLSAREAKALIVACPVCRAEAGDPCESRIKPNDIVSPHILRQEVAERGTT